MSKMYLPSNLINSNYLYRVNQNYILVITNQNCTGNGSARSCSCVAYFFNEDIVGKTAKCNTYVTETTTNYTDYTSFTSDFWYRKDIASILIIFFILFIFIVKYPMRIFMRLFGRWLKL